MNYKFCNVSTYSSEWVATSEEATVGAPVLESLFNKVARLKASKLF